MACSAVRWLPEKFASARGREVLVVLVPALVFKTSVGLNQVPGGFDSHPPPPNRAGQRFRSGANVMNGRVEQPPINPLLRDPERHDFWPAFVLVLIGLMILVCGARHLTEVETTEGETAREVQLIKAFSSGGIRFLDLSSPPPPLPTDDPLATARALEAWDRQNSNGGPPQWKVRVDTGAKTPCPT